MTNSLPFLYMLGLTKYFFVGVYEPMQGTQIRIVTCSHEYYQLSIGRGLRLDTPDIKFVCSKVLYVMHTFDERNCTLGYKFTQLNTESLKEQLVNETVLHSIIFSLFLHH